MRGSFLNVLSRDAINQSISGAPDSINKTLNTSWEVKAPTQARLQKNSKHLTEKQVVPEFLTSL